MDSKDTPKIEKNNIKSSEKLSNENANKKGLKDQENIKEKSTVENKENNKKIEFQVSKEEEEEKNKKSSFEQKNSLSKPMDGSSKVKKQNMKTNQVKNLLRNNL